MNQCADNDPRLTAIHLRKDLLGDGYDTRAIGRMIRSGEIERVRHGAYVDGRVWRETNTEDRFRLRTRAVLRQAQTDAVASHLSAMAEWDVPIWDLALSDVDVTRVDQRAGRREAGVRQHQGRLLEEHVVVRNGIRVTSATRTALDCTQVLNTEHSLSVVNDLLHRGLTTPKELEQCRAFMERWPRTLNADLVLRLSDAAIESVGESRFFHLCWRARLPIPTLQHEVKDEWGRVIGTLDFLWRRHGVFAEFDGKVKYGPLLKPGQTATDAVIREKSREDDIRETTGWRCIRISWADLYKPEQLVARVRRAFDAQAAAFRQPVRRRTRANGATQLDPA